MELISIIIPVYNIKEYLRECVDSLLRQTYQKIEIILVDDGSTDGSSQLCDYLAEKDFRIRVIHQKNEGVSSARNIGIADARGQYITFVDGDDWVEENFIETLYNSLVQYDADVSAVGHMRCLADGTKQVKAITDKTEVIFSTSAFYRKCDKKSPWIGYAGGKLVRKEIIEHNALEFDTEIRIFEDFIFFYSLFEHVQKIVKNPETLYNYRIRPSSATQTAGKSLDLLNNKITALEKALKIAEKYPDSIFLSKVETTLFSAMISYLAAMFRMKCYDKMEILRIREKLSDLTSGRRMVSLPFGIKIRTCIFYVSPRLLYYFEQVLSVIRK